MDKRDKREAEGKGCYVCPLCGGKYPNSEWRQKHPERTTCQDGHRKVKMLWYPKDNRRGGKSH